MNSELFNNQHIFVIAEIGKNFIQTAEDRSVEEYLQNARALILAAKKAGADAVKFQTHVVHDEQMDIPVTAPHFSGSERHAWIKRNEAATPPAFWRALKTYADEIGIVFFTTPMSRGAAHKVAELDLPLWKVGSGDLLDFVLLDYLAQTGKPIILSSGMSTLDEVDAAVAFLKKRTAQFALLHCVSRYPCPVEDLQLPTIGLLRERYGVPVGFSDHSIGHEGVAEAIRHGARIIEKHFSVSRDLWGSDHKVSMTPAEFAAMVRDVRELEKDLPQSVAVPAEGKTLQPDEAVFRPFFRKTLVAARPIAADEEVTADAVHAMRPQGYVPGLPSEAYGSILGRRPRRAIAPFEPLTDDMFE